MTGESVWVEVAVSVRPGSGRGRVGEGKRKRNEPSGLNSLMEEWKCFGKGAVEGEVWMGGLPVVLLGTQA